MSLPVPPRPDIGADGSVTVAGAGSRPRATWSGLEAIGLFLVANILIGQVVVASILAIALGIEVTDGGADAPLLALSAVVAVSSLALMWLWMRSRHPGWAASMGLVREDWTRDALWGGVAGLVVYPIITLGVGNVVLFLLGLAFGEGVETPEQVATETLSAAGRAIAILYGVGIAPIAEEFFFRGILFRGIADRRGFWPAALVSGALFGLVHLPVGEPLGDALVLPLVLGCAGVAFAWIYERRQRLVASIAAHMVFNVIGLVLLFALPEGG